MTKKDESEKKNKRNSTAKCNVKETINLPHAENSKRVQKWIGSKRIKKGNENRLKGPRISLRLRQFRIGPIVLRTVAITSSQQDALAHALWDLALRHVLVHVAPVR